MKKDLCASCTFNTERGGLNLNCLFDCAEVTEVSGDPSIVLACNDYVSGDPLPIDVTPERLHKIYLQLFPERRRNGGYPVNDPTYCGERKIYRVTIPVECDGALQDYAIDIGAVTILQALKAAKKKFKAKNRTAYFRDFGAGEVNAVEYFEFTPLASKTGKEGDLTWTRKP